jgi:copper chaperone NosL
MRPVLSVILMLMIVSLLGACGGKAVDPDKPPQIVYGEDVCDQCHMIISDERFAAGLVVETAPGEYESRIFDDIGNMFTYAVQNGTDLSVITYWVHDYNSQEWIEARSAHFVRSEGIHTPMGYGVIAVKQQPEAEALAQEWEGEVLSFEQVRVQLPRSVAADHSHDTH